MDEEYTAIQDYYLRKSSNLDVVKVHQDLMRGDALLYCSVVEKVFIGKYERIISELNLAKEQKGLLLSIISS